jgi:hypothetical protein
MGQPAEMVNVLTDRAVDADLDYGLARPLSARKALALWVALSVMGWAAIGMTLEMVFF